ncbi:Adhesion G-protein coupled receptor G2 [Dissostichus eleginoides]|uniref:Adhesion G-protein coupled receptor G2 n=1 Tax=Dissostichus eleginoides TaxID=100907 RepID=A0AAD9BGE3_DISEL|nr:Adhesion G-protein coupled receptor G2 [Dissostichus eleginoides]
MSQGNEAKMKRKSAGFCSYGSSSRHTFGPSVRLEKAGSCVKHYHCLQILLLAVLLAGQASCVETADALPTVPPTNTQPSVYSFFVVTVDVNEEKDEAEIIAWLKQAFANKLHTCLSPNIEETDVAPTSPQTTSPYTSYETTLDLCVSCINKTAIRETNCTVLLRLKQQVPLCCIFRTLYEASHSSSDIHVVGANKTVYNPCNCSAYCNGVEAYYTFQFSVQDSKMNFSYVSSMIYNLSKPDCPSREDHGRKNMGVELKESCDVEAFTPSPDVTTSQPNTSTSSVNVTSSTSSVNVTGSTSSVNVTSSTSSVNETSSTSSVNVTSSTSSVNVTSSTLTATSPALNATLTTANVPESAESQANALLELTKDMSKLNSSQVRQLVSKLERLLSGPTVSFALGNISVHIVSNLLGATPEVLSDSSNSIIGVVDTVGLKLVLDGKVENLLSSAVALSVKPADGSNFQETVFSISDPKTVQVRGGPSRPSRKVRAVPPLPQGSIKLPPSLTEDLTSQEQQLVSRVQFNFYQKDTVYQDSSLRGKRKLNSGILGASAANLTIKELQDDVVIQLKNTELILWLSAFSGTSHSITTQGAGIQEGCSVRKSTDNETVCGCNHLTSFAILLDLARQPLTSRTQATILTFITYIGCGVSAIFLSITLLTYLAFGKLRKDIPSKILIQLCLALLLLNLVFLVDAWLALYPEAVGLCISTAWFLHYFLLVTFTWMGLEAVHMYLALVKVFNSYISHYMVKFSLVGWGVPMIVVIIVIAVDKDNYGLVSYGRFSDGTSDGFCWLKNDIAFYVSVVAYFCLIFVFNFVMFVVVLVQLCRIKRQNPHNLQHRSILQDMRSVSGITILLGLTWGFAFFAWGPLNLPFMYLFAIFNSFQGFFIFIFYCAGKENVRKQWRTFLCCGRMRLAENSEWSRTATQKTATSHQ